jgi:hypothetical protein
LMMLAVSHDVLDSTEPATHIGLIATAHAHHPIG